jgi:hypothetical protein
MRFDDLDGLDTLFKAENQRLQQGTTPTSFGQNYNPIDTEESFTQPEGNNADQTPAKQREITPTEEQKEIILTRLTPGKILTIQAAAGCAKTTTATMLAFAHPQKRIVYVTFNKANQLDAEAKMPSNVIVKTWFALALCHYPSIYGRVEQNLPNVYQFGQLAQKVTTPNNCFKVASFSREVFKEFCNSGVLRIDEHFIRNVQPSRTTLKDIAMRSNQIMAEKERHEQQYNDLLDLNELPSIRYNNIFNHLSKQERARIARCHRQTFRAEVQAALIARHVDQFLAPTLTLTQQLWANYVRAMDNPRATTRVPHAVYLKKFQLDALKLNADMFILDEGQDTNPVCWEIFKNQDHTSRVLIGDTNQAIYAWRGARNAMDKAELEFLPANRTERTLSSSFRYGPHVADVANTILHSIQHTKVKVVGQGAPTQIRVGPHEENFRYLFRPNQKTTLIARTNLHILLAAYDLVGIGAKISINGGIEALRFDMIRDILDLKNGANAPSLTSAEIKLAKDYNELAQLCESGLFPDIQLAFTLSKHPEIRVIMREIQKQHVNDELNADVYLTTAHRAKGLEWENVCVAGNYTHWNLRLEETNDFAPKATTIYEVFEELRRQQTSGELSPIAEEYFTRLKEEANLLYVAVTRAQKTLTLSPNIAKDIKILFDKNQEKLQTFGVQLPYQLPNRPPKQPTAHPTQSEKPVVAAYAI